MYRNWNVFVAGLCAITLWLGQPLVADAQVSRAEGQVTTPGKLGKLERKMEELESRTISETLDLKIYGYVDVSYTGNLNNPAAGKNMGRIFDVDSDSFRVHMAQIVIEKVGKLGGNLVDNTGFRVKLNFGEDSQFTGGTDSADNEDFQEVYAQFIAPWGNGLDLRIGRQNTLIGYEVIESPYNDNFSRSWLFGLGQPFTTTGLRGAYDITENLSFAIGFISGFTQQTGDTNSALSIETALSYSPIDRLGLTGYVFYGEEKGRKDPGAGDVILLGGIGSFQFTEQTKMILEGYYANAANASGLTAAQDPSQNARWNGVAAYLIHDFTEQWGLRIRGEIFEDASASRTCLASIGTSTADGGEGPNKPPPPAAGVCFTPTGLGARNSPSDPNETGTLPTAQTMWETTFTLQYKPVPPFITRVEFRYDKSDANTFQFGTRSANHQETLAVEVIYLF